MLESLNQDISQVLTFKQFIQKHPWPNMSTLRSMYRKRKLNGLDKAFPPSGGRVIIVDDGILFGLIKGKK